MPSRSRPEKLISNVIEYQSSAAQPDKVKFLVSLDEDDETIQQAIEQLSWRHNVSVVVCTSKSKIDACNRDMKINLEWDIVVLASDDMRVKVDGWDNIIRENMLKYFHDTDGCLWFNDGAQHSAGTQQMICTLSILGRKYYDRIGYIYHPEYKSFFCDNEFTEVAQAEGKLKYINQCIIRHEHPAWGHGKQDELYKANDAHWKHDQDLYHIRKAKGFK
jgi:hypothetical protein